MPTFRGGGFPRGNMGLNTAPYFPSTPRAGGGVQVHADASGLLRRIARIREAVANIAPYKLVDAAVDAIGEISDSAVTRLAAREDQVGFDLAQFLRNIQQPGPLAIKSPGVASIGILDVIQMGTLADFEAIGEIPDLWHFGQRRGEAFRRQVFDYPDKRDDLARMRQAIWGDKTPQWYLLEHGYPGDGAYPAVPAANFIATATRSDRMTLLLRNAMSSALRGIPRS